MVLVWPGQGLSELLCPSRMICERAGDVSKVAGFLFAYSFVLLYFQGRKLSLKGKCSDREPDCFGTRLDFSFQLCPLMGENVRGLLVSFFQSSGLK